MKVAVWDTYVKMPNGNVLNFDIIVSDEMQDAALILNYGKTFLETQKGFTAQLDTTQCQFCHIEEPSPDIIAAIEKQGYSILELSQIPPTLPTNPTRRELILHLRAFVEQYRFADFSGVSTHELHILVKQIYLADTYSPIACSFYDVLQEKATLKERCQITYFTPNKEALTEEAVITDVFTQNGEELITLESGKNIRLDAIIGINNLYAPISCKVG